MLKGNSKKLLENNEKEDLMTWAKESKIYQETH